MIPQILVLVCYLVISNGERSVDKVLNEGERFNLTAVLQPKGPQVKLCRVTLDAVGDAMQAHHFIWIGDGGCWPHIQEDGSFRGESQHQGYFPEEGQLFRGESHLQRYKRKLCPFFTESEDHKFNRKVLYRFASLSDLWHKGINPGHAPFAISDLAKSCIYDQTDAVKTMMNAMRVKTIEPTRFCDIMLSFPLMFDAFGFDDGGITVERRSFSVFSYQGEYLSPIRANIRRGWNEWNYLNEVCTQDLGDQQMGRIVVRALLPTFYRYVSLETRSIYATSIKGISAFTTSVTSPFSRSNFKDQLRRTCFALANLPEFVDLLSLKNVQDEGLLSSSALNRDRTQCSRISTCNYGPEKMGVCDQCLNPKKPCLMNRAIRCSEDDGAGSCASMNKEKCGPPKTCTCYEAVHTTLTSEFESAMKYGAEKCMEWTKRANDAPQNGVEPSLSSVKAHK